MTPNIERLTHLVGVLERVEDAAFGIENWMNECGTVGCAIGWACSDPVFRSLGLSLKRPGENSTHKFYPAFNGSIEPKVVFEFFGLTFRASAFFFAPSSYTLNYPATRANVIDRLRAFIAEHQPAPVIEPEVVAAMDRVRDEVA